MEIIIKDTPDTRKMILDCVKNGEIQENNYRKLLLHISDICKQLIEYENSDAVSLKLPKINTSMKENLTKNFKN